MSPEPTDELFLRIADRLKTISEPTRLKILHLLENRELTVSQILAAVGGSQANISKHLARMRHGGLVAARREGTAVYYRVSDPTAFAICKTVCDALEERAAEEHRMLRDRRESGGDR